MQTQISHLPLVLPAQGEVLVHHLAVLVSEILIRVERKDGDPRVPQERFQDRFGTDLGRFFGDFQRFFDALAAVSSDVLVCYIVPKVLTMSFHLAVDL